MGAGLKIREMVREDWSKVRAIYAEGLATGLAAFAVSPPRWESWDKGHLCFGRVVAESDDGLVLGWAALSAVPDT
jgi:L-amino acid N-acyltransferase YncA